MSRYSGIRQGLERIADRQAQRRFGAVDEALKMEQLKDLQGKRQIREQFGSGQKFGDYTFNPITDKFEMDPIAKKRKELEIKREFELSKPLSAEAAQKLSGSLQGLQQSKNIKKIFGLQRDATGRASVGPDYGKKVFGMKAASYREPSLGPVKLFGGATEGLVQSFAGDEARKLDLHFETLAEDNLRARTGAAATPAEIQREKQRLMSRYLDSPEVALSRLEESDTFLGQTAEAMRPGSTAKFGEVENQATEIPDWASSDPEAFLYAKSSGFNYSDDEIREWFRQQGLLKP